MDAELAREIEDVRDEIRDAIDEATIEQRRALADIDVQRILDELTSDVPDSVRAFVDEVDVAAVVRRALAATR